MSCLWSCDILERVEEKSAKINRYEQVSLKLAKNKRDLQEKINELEYQVQKLKSKNKYLELQLEKASGKRGSRVPASVQKFQVQNDEVQFETYRWEPSELLAMADKSFKEKDYEKSAQFYQSFHAHFPDHKIIDDAFLYKAGVAAFESGKHHNWALKNLNQLVKNYPNSPFYRGAKLWMGMTHLKQGKKEMFFNTVEEFRKKYRNTQEWKILSLHYEKIVQDYKPL